MTYCSILGHAAVLQWLMYCLIPVAQFTLLLHSRTHKSRVWLWSLCSILAAHICNSCTWDLMQEDCGFSVILGYRERFCFTPLLFLLKGKLAMSQDLLYCGSLKKHTAGYYIIFWSCWNNCVSRNRLCEGSYKLANFYCFCHWVWSRQLSRVR